MNLIGLLIGAAIGTALGLVLRCPGQCVPYNDSLVGHVRHRRNDRAGMESVGGEARGRYAKNGDWRLNFADLHLQSAIRHIGKIQVPVPIFPNDQSPGLQKYLYVS